MAVGVSLSRAQNPHMGSEQREAVPQTLHFGAGEMVPRSRMLVDGIYHC